MKQWFLRFCTFSAYAFISFSSFADVAPNEGDTWDLEAFAGFRSYPLGAGLGVEGGYNDYIWGEKSSDPLSWGYVRISGLFQTSGLVNKGEAKLSVYPIPVVGLWVDYRRSLRNLDEIQTLDCRLLKCDGSLSRTRIGGEMKGAYSIFFARLQTSYSWLEPEDSSGPYADESTNLQVLRGGDQMFTWNIALGGPVHKDLQIAGFIEKNKMQEGGFSNILRGLYLQNSWEKHMGRIGVGLYSSDTSRLHGSVFASYSYQFSKGLGL